MKETELDALDRAILGALLEDGRLSQVELAERVPLSATAIARRIRALEERGVIEGYQARVSREALGYMEAMMALPAWGQWRKAALAETWIVPEDEADWPEVLTA